MLGRLSRSSSRQATAAITINDNVRKYLVNFFMSFQRLIS
jgi:hypothetical protein